MLAPLPLQFHHVPLYLEWAPVGVFSSTAPQGKEPQEASAEKNMVEPETGKNRSMSWEGRRGVGGEPGAVQQTAALWLCSSTDQRVSVSDYAGVKTALKNSIRAG